MIDTYKREVGACEKIIMVQKDNESKLINGIESDEEWERQQLNKKKSLEEEQAREFEEEEKRIRQEALNIAKETELEDDDYDEEKARSAAAEALKNLND